MTDLLVALTEALLAPEPAAVRDAWGRPDPGPGSPSRMQAPAEVWAWLSRRAPGLIRLWGAAATGDFPTLTIANLTVSPRAAAPDSGWPAGTQIVALDENTLTVALPDADGNPGWTVTVDEGLDRLVVQGDSPRAFLLALARDARAALDAAAPEWAAAAAAAAPVTDARYADDLFAETVGDRVILAVLPYLRDVGDDPLPWLLVDGRPTLDLGRATPRAWAVLPPRSAGDSLAVDGTRLSVVPGQPPTPPPPDVPRVFQGRLP